jgi:hypothetical protein
MSTIVIMPGGFHPFHAGHAALYQSAVKAFPGAEVFVAATNDTSNRPFPFAIKEKLARLAGVQPGHFVQVKSPFRAEEITAKFNPEKDRLIFVRSEKDADKPPQAGGVKKNGEPAYLQLLAGQTTIAPFGKHAYMAYLPTVEFGPGMTSATEIRTAWPTLNEKRKTALVMSLYPRTQTSPKLAQTVVKLLDAAIGGDSVEEDISRRGFLRGLGAAAVAGAAGSAMAQSRPVDVSREFQNMRQDDPRVQHNKDIEEMARAIYEQIVATRGQPIDRRQQQMWMDIAREKATQKLAKYAPGRPAPQSQSSGFPAQGSERRVSRNIDNFESQGVTEDADRAEAQASYMEGQCMVLAVAINQHNPTRYPIGYIWEYNMSAGAPDMQMDDDEWNDLSPEEQQEISNDISRHSVVHAYVRDQETNEYIDARGRHKTLPNLWGRMGQTRFEEFPGTARELIEITAHGDWDEVGDQVNFKRGQPAFDSLAGPAGVKRALDYAVKYLGVVGPEQAKSPNVPQGVELVDLDTDVDQNIYTLTVDGETVSFTYWDSENNFETPNINDIYQQAKEQLGKKLSPENVKEIARAVFKSFQQGMTEGAPIVVAQAPIDVRNPKKAPQPYRNQGDIVPPTKPPSTEKRGVKGRPGQRPMPDHDVAESNMLGSVMFKSKPPKLKKIQPAASRTKDFMKKDFSLSEDISQPTFQISSYDDFNTAFEVEMIIDNNNAGFFSYQYFPETNDVENDVDIHSDQFRGQGYGKMLLLKAIETAQEHNLPFKVDRNGVTPAQGNVYRSLIADRIIRINPDKTIIATGKSLPGQGVEENQGWAATFTNEETGQMAGTPAIGGMWAGYQDRENQPIGEDYVEEKWSQKYKSSINCSNPKGFSQRAHCAGRKK